MVYDHKSWEAIDVQKEMCWELTKSSGSGETENSLRYPLVFPALGKVAAVTREGLGEAAGAGSHRAMGCGKELGFPLQVVEGPGWF